MSAVVEIKEFDVAIRPEDALTPRQLELIALYASGYQVSDIASVKFLSPYTVRNILTLARERTGAKSLTHLCVLCVDNGLLHMQDGKYVPVQAERIVGE